MADTDELVAIEVHGWRESMQILAALPSEVRHAVFGDLEAVGREATAEAAGRVHSRTGATAAGYRVATTSRGVSLRNSVVGARVLEYAGKLHPEGRVPRGRALIRTLNSQYGPIVGGKGRLLWRSVLDRKERIEAAAQSAVEAIERELSARGLA